MPNKFLAAIDTPGGHILVCSIMIIVGGIMFKINIPKGEDIIVGAVAVLFAAMRGKGSQGGDGK